MSRKQYTRLDVLNKANAGFITVQEAAAQLGLSERQIQRLKKEMRKNGPAALIHKNTLKQPANKMEEGLKDKILEIRKRPGYKQANYKLQTLSRTPGSSTQHSNKLRNLMAASTGGTRSFP